MYLKSPSKPSILSRVSLEHLYHLFLDISPTHFSEIFQKWKCRESTKWKDGNPKKPGSLTGARVAFLAEPDLNVALENTSGRVSGIVNLLPIVWACVMVATNGASKVSISPCLLIFIVSVVDHVNIITLPFHCRVGASEVSTVELRCKGLIVVHVHGLDSIGRVYEIEVIPSAPRQVPTNHNPIFPGSLKRA